MARECLKLSKAPLLDIHIIGFCPAELAQSIRANLVRARLFDISPSNWEEGVKKLSLLNDIQVPKLEALRLHLLGTTAEPFPLTL